MLASINPHAPLGLPHHAGDHQRNVRVEKLQEITDHDAMAEGVNATDYGKSHRYGFSCLWESINGPGAWDANPWVWVIEFRKLP